MFCIWFDVAKFLLGDIIFVSHNYVLLRVKEQRNILHEIRKRKANWIGHILRRNAFYNGLLKERYERG
jgi:hypothetical protein